MSIANIRPRWKRRIALAFFAPFVVLGAPIIYGTKEAVDVFVDAIQQVINVWRKP